MIDFFHSYLGLQLVTHFIILDDQ